MHNSGSTETRKCLCSSNTGYAQLQFSSWSVAVVNQEIKDMRINYFQHVPFEGLGTIEQWIRARGYHLTATKLYQNDPLPDMDSVDWFIIMGGPMGVHDEDRLPWLKSEKRLIEEAMRQGQGCLRYMSRCTTDSRCSWGQGVS